MGKTWRLPPIPPKLVVAPPTQDLRINTSNPDVYFKVTGSKSLQDTLLRIGIVARNAVGAEMSAIGRDIIDDAREIVPQLSFRLRDSGDCDQYQPGDPLEIGVWFGGLPTGESSGLENVSFAKASQSGLHEQVDPSVYAAEQHETLHMNYTTPGTGPKYLERPFMEHSATVERRLAIAIENAMGGGLNQIFSDLTNAPAYPGYGKGYNGT